MPHISGHLWIAAPVARVFDVAADSRNEPSYNPAMHDVQLLTPLPIGLGTRFLARMGRTDMEMEVELIEFDRPRRLGSCTTSTMMTTTGTLTFEEQADGTVLRWDWDVRPRGWWRVAGRSSDRWGAAWSTGSGRV